MADGLVCFRWPGILLQTPFILLPCTADFVPDLLKVSFGGRRKQEEKGEVMGL